MTLDTSQCSGTCPEPLHAGRLEADIGVETAGDGAVDDGLLLLLQQLDQLLLGVDVAPNPPVHVVEEPDDGGLLKEGWEGQRRPEEGLVRQLKAGRPDALGPHSKFPVKRCGPHKLVHEVGREAGGIS